MRKKLQLFVWVNVLSDYSDGIMFALAHDVEEARKAIIASAGGSVAHDLAKEPEVFDNVVGFAVWGGG